MANQTNHKEQAMSITKTLPEIDIKKIDHWDFCKTQDLEVGDRVKLGKSNIFHEVLRVSHPMGGQYVQIMYRTPKRMNCIWLDRDVHIQLDPDHMVWNIDDC